MLLASRYAGASDARVFHRRRYRRSPVRLVLDTRGAIARYLGIRGYPEFVILDRRGRRAGPVRHSFAAARRALSR